MKKILALALILSVVSISTSCKKYPNGPRISLRTKKARLVNDWQLDKYFEKGIEVDIADNDYGTNWVFEKDNRFYIKDNDGTTLYAGDWEFSVGSGLLPAADYDGHKTEIRTEFFERFGRKFFKIRKLKNKELWIEVGDNGEEYRFVEK